MKFNNIDLIKHSKQNLELIFYTSLLCFFVVFIVPLFIIVNNLDEFSGILISDYILDAIPAFIVLFLIITTITFISSYFIPAITSNCLLFLLSYTIICGLFFPIREAMQLDGRPDDLLPGVSYLTLTILTVFIAAGIKWFKKELKFSLMMGAIFVVAFIIYKLALLVNEGKLIEKETFVSTNKPNVFVISLDGLQSNIIEEVLKRNPEMKNSFRGFTFYPNVVTVAPLTRPSLEFIRMGFVPHNGKKRIERRLFYKTKYYKNFITSLLKRESYKLLFNGHFQEGERKPNIYSNKVMGRKDFFLIALNASLYRYIPFQFNMEENYFYSFYQHLKDSLKDDADKNLFLNIKKDQVLHSIDKRFIKYIFKFDKYVSSLIAGKYGSAAHFMHFNFTHNPISFDAHCTYYFHKNLKQDRASLYGEATCGMVKLQKFIKKIKSLGIYDNSIIFLISDHGSEGRFFKDEPFSQDKYNFGKRWTLSRYKPLLMVKPIASDDEPLKENLFQASLLDITRTICKNLVDNDSCEIYTGVNLFDKKEKLNATSRYVLITQKYVNAHKNISGVKEINIFDEKGSKSKGFSNFMVIDIGRELSIAEYFKATVN